MMDSFSTLAESPWRYLPGMAVGLVGLMILTNGLMGEHGMFRRGIGMIARIEGWRLSVLGLSVMGLGAAWIWESKLFLFLALGIGFTEIREASSVITATKGEKGRPKSNGASASDAQLPPQSRPPQRGRPLSA